MGVFDYPLFHCVVCFVCQFSFQSKKNFVYEEVQYSFRAKYKK